MPRNSSGTYSLPAGNPVVTGTLIETNWANPTMSDIGSAITDSLDRFGRGGMLAQLKLADGTLAAPAFAFNSEASTGLYRPAAATLNVSVLATLVASFTNTAISLAKATTITGTTLINGALTVTGLLTASGGLVLGSTLTWAGGAAATPGLAVLGDTDTGFYSSAANTLGASTNGVSRWLTTDEGLGLNATVIALANVGPQLQVRGRDATHGGMAAAIESGGNAWLSLYSGITVADNPSVVFNSTGVLRFGTSTAYPLTGYAELMRLNAAGQLGIGGLPDARLTVNSGDIHVNPAAATDGQVVVNRATVAAAGFGLNSSASTNSFGAVAGAAYVGAVAGSSNPPLVFTQAATERQRIDTNGNIGFNQPSPANFAGYTTVEAKGKSGGGGGLYRSTSSDAVVSADFSVVSAGGSSNGSIGTFTAHPFLLTTSGAERVRIDSAGRVGIATTAAAANILHILGNEQIDNGNLTFGGTGAAAASGPSMYRVGASDQLAFSINGSEKMRLDANGILMLGRTSSFAARYLAQIGGGVAATSLLSATSDQFAIAVTQATGNGVYFLGARNAAAAPDLQFSNNAGSARFVMTDDGRFYGNALHNNAGAVTGTTNQYVASGTYSPTISGGGNITSPTLGGSAKWMRVGNVVHVCVTCSGTVTADSTLSVIGITLPIASNFTVFSDCIGTATANVTAGNYARDAQAAAVQGSAASDIAQIVFTSQVGSAGTVRTFTAVFLYEIL